MGNKWVTTLLSSSLRSIAEEEKESRYGCDSQPKDRENQDQMITTFSAAEYSLL